MTNGPIAVSFEAYDDLVRRRSSQCGGYSAESKKLMNLSGCDCIAFGALLSVSVVVQLCWWSVHAPIRQEAAA
jgi:hypothetical protein